MVYTIRVILLLAHVESFKLSYCVKNKKKGTLQRVSLSMWKKAQLAILITTVVWDNVLKGESVRQQAHYQAKQKRVV